MKECGDSDEGRDDQNEVSRLVEAAGPRGVLPADDLASIRGATRAAWSREVFESRRGARRAWMPRVAVAASLVGVFLLTWWFAGRNASAPPVVIASIERLSGNVTIGATGEGVHRLGRGDSIPEGSELKTGHAGDRVSLRLNSGNAVRFDEGTRATVVSARVIELEEGALYVDTRGAEGGIEIRTRSGVAKDIGTQFSVRISGPEHALQVRVREGSVLVEQAGTRRTAPAGTELVVTGGSFAERPILGWGPDWEWILAAAPVYEIEGQTLRDFLTWCSRETGWAIRFEDSSIEKRTDEIILHGTIEGSGPGEAPSAVLAGSGLIGEVTDGTLVIREGTP